MRRIRALEDVAAWRLCLGCGACAAVSECGSVVMQEVVAEGYRPAVDRRMGGHAGNSLQVCPAVETLAPVSLDGRQLSAVSADAWGPVLELWEGHACDPEVRFQGSSGGLLSALSCFCLERKGFHGVIHIGQDPEDPLRNCTGLSRCRADLLKKTGSRYAPAAACDRLDLMEQAPAPCVFIGQPSEVCALAKARRLRPALDAKVGLSLSFFCAGSPARLGTLKLLEKLGIDCGRVAELRYRGRGWPGMFSVTLRGETKPAREITYEESWRFVQAYRPWSVQLWPDGTGEWADISCGDAWHRTPQPGDLGSSLVVLRTERGRAIFHEACAAGYIEAKPAKPDMLAQAAAGLLEKKRAIWGRLATMRLFGLPVPRHRGQRLFRLWLGLPFKEKLRSTFGTARRIVQRKYWRPQELPSFDGPALEGDNRTTEPLQEDSR